MSSSRLDDRNKGMAYEWHQKDHSFENKSYSISRTSPPVFSEFPSRNRGGELGSSEPKSFFMGATDDDDSEHYASRW
jgi:hypothetical protein